ncbi:MAG: AAA family ATPase [Pseudonocardia sp.]|nr:AAA family ATPase [Pseudonocardia sp.]
MDGQLTRISARNFRSLASVDLDLGDLTVLIGPNGSGKTNVLNVLRFLASTVQFDLAAALESWRGFDHVQRQVPKTGAVSITVEGRVTQYASENAPDRYHMRLTRRGRSVSRYEEFTFKRRGGRGRRITVNGDLVTITEDDDRISEQRLATRQTTGLATLPKLADEEGGLGIRQFTEFLSSIRVLEPNVDQARLPARQYGAPLAEDASNLADTLGQLRLRDPDSFALLIAELRRCLPGLEEVQLVPVGGAAKSVAVQLIERGVVTPIDLADASYGTVRTLALLTALHQPDPPPFVAIEEIDHGLHPYALDVLLDRMRASSGHMQILAATHSPTLVGRMEPHEIVVCDRDPVTGESIIPAISSAEIAAAARESDWNPGELWFAGAIGGIPA